MFGIYDHYTTTQENVKNSDKGKPRCLGRHRGSRERVWKEER